METNIKGTWTEEGSRDREVQRQMWGKEGRKEFYPKQIFFLSLLSDQKLESVRIHTWWLAVSYNLGIAYTAANRRWYKRRFSHKLNLFIVSAFFWRKMPDWRNLVMRSNGSCHALLQIVTVCDNFARSVLAWAYWWEIIREISGSCQELRGYKDVIIFLIT